MVQYLRSPFCGGSGESGLNALQSGQAFLSSWVFMGLPHREPTCGGGLGVGFSELRVVFLEAGAVEPA